MAERSKEPDSSAKRGHNFSITNVCNTRDFWSTCVGVGSNPTPDKSHFRLIKIIERFCVGKIIFE